MCVCGRISLFFQRFRRVFSGCRDSPAKNGRRVARATGLAPDACGLQSQRLSASAVRVFPGATPSRARLVSLETFFDFERVYGNKLYRATSTSFGSGRKLPHGILDHITVNQITRGRKDPHYMFVVFKYKEKRNDVHGKTRKEKKRGEQSRNFRFHLPTNSFYHEHLF